MQSCALECERELDHALPLDRELDFTSLMLSRLVRAASRAVGTDRSMSTLETLAFDNRALKKLPIDQEKDNYVRSVPGGVVYPCS